MKYSRVVAFLLSFVLFFGQIPINVSAAGNNGVSAYFSVNVDGFIGVIDTPDASAVPISTADELYAIRNDMYGSYVLKNDIDLSDYENWTPIGTTPDSAFHGKFDGQGHSITGLHSEESFDSGSLTGVSYTSGLFGVCDGAEIKNVRIGEGEVSIETTSGYRYDDAAITSDYSVYAGMLIGYACNDTVIYNCNTSGNVSAKASGEGYSDSIAGGLAGFINSGIISYSYSNCVVDAYNGNATTAYDAYAGGLVGAVDNDIIIDKSYNEGNVTSQTLDYGDAYAGGLSGATDTGVYEITDSFNTGQVMAQTGHWFCDDAYAGGLVGSFSGRIDSAYNSGKVSAHTVDSYGIGGGNAYAGGICGISTSSSTIDDSAIVQPSVSATSSANEYQYRISYQGTKNNNITINSVTTGSTNDADFVQAEAELKTEDPYKNILGWNFDTIWQMVSGYDFPRLQQVNVESDEYEDEYIAQHLSFIDGEIYKKILSEERWAQIYWSDANTLASDIGDRLYNVIDSTVSASVDLSEGNLGFLFEDNNPYKVILADYISNQASYDWMEETYESKIPQYLEEIQAAVNDFIKEIWHDEWGKLSDEDIFWLFHYKDRPSEDWVNSDFENHLAEIVKETNSKGQTLGTILHISDEVFNAVLDFKDWTDLAGQYVHDVMSYAANVEAYISTTEDFKEVLRKMCNHLPDSTSEEKKDKAKLEKILESYIDIDSSNSVNKILWENYLFNPTAKLNSEIMIKVITDGLTDWMNVVFPKKVLDRLKVVVEAADITWKFYKYLTKQGELTYCREMLRANAYFESAMYKTLESIESDFRSEQTRANAELFDTAYKFFKETELYSMDTCIAYCDTYQTSWAQAIKNLSNTFMNSFIDEVHIHKLYLYRAYCHGTKYNLGGKVITVACPTDVIVYDQNGNIAASIENNVITNINSDVLAYTADDVKLIFIPLDQKYEVKISATDNGSMDYSICEYDENLQTVQSVVYSDIMIQKGQSFTGNVSTDLNENPDDYNLRRNDNTMIDSYEKVDGETMVPVTSVQLSSEKDKLQVGETLSLTANIIPADATTQSLVWSSSDPAIAEVSEEGVVTAKTKGRVEIKVQSLYGGINAKLVLIVDEKDTEEDNESGDDQTSIKPPESSTEKPVQKPSENPTETLPQKPASGSQYPVSSEKNAETSLDAEIPTTENDEVSDEADILAVGDCITDFGSNAIYRITNNTDENRTVEYVKPLTQTAKIIISSTVVIQGKSYQVIAIANKAFKNSRKVKKIVIPSTVKNIGKQAFFNCKKLKNIVIKTKKLKNNSVGKKAFKGISAKAVIKVPKVKRAMYQKILGKKGIGNKNKIK